MKHIILKIKENTPQNHLSIQKSLEQYSIKIQMNIYIEEYMPMQNYYVVDALTDKAKEHDEVLKLLMAHEAVEDARPDITLR